MRHRLKFIILLFSLIANQSASASYPLRNPGEISHGEQELKAFRLIVRTLNTFNYKKVGLNDSISSVIFDRYIKSLDPSRIYFTRADMDEVEKFRLTMDDDLRQAELQHAYKIYNIYKFRYENRYKYALSSLSAAIDLKKKEFYAPDRKSMAFLSSLSASDQYWQRKIKYDLLTLESGRKDLKANIENLKKRYQNLLKQSELTSSSEVFQLFMDAYIGAIDPHAAYFSPVKASEFNSSISRSLEGIGVSLAVEDELITIKNIVNGGPASKTGLLDVGDKIMAIKQADENLFTDVVGWKLNNAIALIKGPKGTGVTLKIRKSGKSNMEKLNLVTVVRDKIIMNDQSVKYQIKTITSEGIANKIAIINIPAFYQDYKAMQAGDKNYKSTTRDVRLILDTLKSKAIDGVMIDLRGNGGGSLNEAVSLAGLFIKSGPMVQTRNVNNNILINKDADGLTFYDGPLAILVDRTSASASEIFAAAMQDYKRAIILGSQTYGKGTVQTPYSLDKMIGNDKVRPVTSDAGEESLGQLNITTDKFYRITGSSTQQKGVKPDVILPSYIPDGKYGEDTEPSALRWDTINPSTFAAVDYIDAPKLSLLSKKHLLRQKNDAAYAAYQSLLKDFTAGENIVSVPLEQDEFLSIQNKKNQTRTLNANKLRMAMGLAPLRNGEKRSTSDDTDYIRKEALKILCDYISDNSHPNMQDQSSPAIINN